MPAINFNLNLKNGDTCTLTVNQSSENQLKHRRIGQILEDTLAELSVIPVESVVELKKANYKLIPRRNLISIKQNINLILTTALQIGISFCVVIASIHLMHVFKWL
jgi:hypothetical protein